MQNFDFLMNSHSKR